MAGEVVRRRVIEDQRGRQPQPGVGGEPVAQLDGGERVEAEVAEEPVRRGGLGRGVPEHGGRVPAHQAQHGPAALLVAHPRHRHGGSLGAGRRGDQAAQQRGQLAGGRPGAPGRQVERGRDDHGRHDGGEDRVEEREALLGGHRQDAGAPGADLVRLAERGGHAAALGPQPPLDGDHGPAGGRAAGRVGVQERVGRRVVRLPAGADAGGRRGEDDERGQVQAGGELVQVPDGVRLRPQHRVDLLVGHRGEQAVADDAGAVHHGGERVAGRHLLEAGAQLVTVGDVGRDDRRLGTGRGQLVEERGRAGRRRPAAADQQEVPQAVPLDQVQGDQPADAAGGAGDQHGAGGVGGPGRGRLRHAGQPRREDPAAAQRQLRLAGGEGGGEQTVGGRGAVGVEQRETPGVLGLRRPQQSPGRGAGRVGARTGRVPGDHHQPGRLQGVRGKPRLHQLQRRADGGAHRAGGGRGGQHDLRDRGAVAHGGGQPREIRERRRHPAHTGRADRGPAAGVPGLPGRDLGPVDDEQRVAAPVPHGPVGGADRRRREHRAPLGVAQVERERVVTGGGQVGPGRRGAGRGQHHAAPVDGQAHVALAGRPQPLGHRDRGGQQRGVDAEARGLRQPVGGQRHLRPQIVGGRAGRLRRAGRDGAGGVPGPRGAGPIVAGVHADRPPPGLVRRAEQHLQLHGAALGQREGLLDGQLGELVAAGLPAGVQGQLDDRGGRGQRVGQGRSGGARDAAGQDEPVAVGQPDGGAEQRVVDRADAEPGHVARRRERVLEPVPLALERVRGQLHHASAGAVEHRRPVHPGPVGVHRRERLDHAVALGPVTAQGGYQRDAGAAGRHAGGGHRGQHRIRAELDEGGHLPVEQQRDAVGEAHRRADVPGPVVGGADATEPAGHVGHHRDAGGLIVEPLGHRP
ncbi:hypothetical protein Ade02nite_90690 [Paractinoplanes deccanensis]|uniref:Uncharacterized protein n=1 Tax=Paractinoplanes deccanensis TaxID=113561 RepID=A0ABQ3YKB3_9ACTN|nr:hypothetical protein Ade02nite_90690 [Actinoplanes deccanensis]